MRRIFSFAVCFLLLQKGAFARIGEIPVGNQGPWFTGTLLSPSGYTIEPGHVNLEPYLYINADTGAYNGKWKPSPTTTFISSRVQVLTQVGVTSFMDVQTFPMVIYNHTENQNTVGFADLPVLVDFQLYKEKPGKWYPAVKLALVETFPTGKYQKLNPNKLQTDAFGQGAFTTTVGLVFTKTIAIGGPQYIRFRLAPSYSVSSSVDVTGFNTYGGKEGTQGTVYPGNEFSAVLGIEYTPALNWAFSLDILGVSGNKDRFSGVRGSTLPTDPDDPFIDVPIGNRSFEQLSLAHAIEYNFSAQIGVIAGAWFSILGRNSVEFINGVAAVNLYF